MKNLISYKRHYNFLSKRTLLATLILIFSLPVFAAFSPRGIPDSSDIRAKLIETWFEAPLSHVRLNQAEIYKAKDGNIFEVRMEERESVFDIIVAPQNFIRVKVYSTDGVRTEIQEMYPVDASGSWVLTRSKETGAPISIKFYFAYGGDIFVHLTPYQKNVTNIDFVIYNMYAARNVPLRLPLFQFYSASLSSLVNWTTRTLPWDYADIHAGVYHDVQQMVAMIRESLPELKFEHDAMYDEYGEPVLISTGEPRRENGGLQNFQNWGDGYAKLQKLATAQNKSLPEGWTAQSSEDVEDKEDVVPKIEDAKKISLSSAGFVKWICDGLVMPIAGGGLLRSPLIVPTVTKRATSYQGVLSQMYNLSFSLDWTRNLASAVRAVESGRELRYPDSGVDIMIEPFNAEATSQGAQRVNGYISNTGYSVRQLRSLLFVLAVTDPGKWYLAALRETDKNVSPEVHVFNECIALFPYFDNNGRFACAAFANCEEIDLSLFVSYYQDAFVHLTRVSASDYFFPKRMSQN